MNCISVDNKKVFVNTKNSLLFSLRLCGFTALAHFCYHDDLPISGTCRTCLVEVKGVEKPVASCIQDIDSTLVIWTESVFSKKARENVFELLLKNHPLDCPICDQAGECDLQDQSKKFAGIFTRHFFKKRSVVDKRVGFFIKTIMTRCIHCTRCIRFNELNSDQTLGMLNRGHNSEIGTYANSEVEFELSGNIIDLCPVGALTARVYAFQSRPWELKIVESVDLTDGFCSSIYIHYKDTEIYKISPKPNKFLNGNIITNKCRFSYDALINNRLKKIYTPKIDATHESYTSMSWFTFLNKTKLLKQKQGLTFIINEDLDVSNCSLLKRLCNKYCGIIKIGLLTKKNNDTNMYILEKGYLLSNLENENKHIFLLSTNIKIECTILNFRIRSIFRKRIISIFCFGRFFNSGLITKFMGLNVKNFLMLNEAKLINVSVLLLQGRSTLLLIGESFSKRFHNFDQLCFKHRFLNVQISQINIFTGDEGQSYLHIKNRDSQRIKKTYFCVNLNDSQLVRKYLLKRSETIYWASTHRPHLKFKSYDYLLPLSTALESYNLFIGLEQRVYKTRPIFSSLYESKNLSSILLSIFNYSDSISICSDIASQFLIEVSRKQYLLTSIKKIKLKYNIGSKNKFKLISLYPLKNSITSHYEQNSFTANSLILKNYRAKLQNSSKNF